jgi:hypothetical protein
MTENVPQNHANVVQRMSMNSTRRSSLRAPAGNAAKRAESLPEFRTESSERRRADSSPVRAAAAGAPCRPAAVEVEPHRVVFGVGLFSPGLAASACEASGAGGSSEFDSGGHQSPSSRERTPRTPAPALPRSGASYGSLSSRLARPGQLLMDQDGLSRHHMRHRLKGRRSTSGTQTETLADSSAC